MTSFVLSVQGQKPITGDLQLAPRLPQGRLFAQLRSDYALWGVSRPTEWGKGAATLGMPQTVKAVEPAWVPITKSWARYWADLFTLQRYGRLYETLNLTEKHVVNNALLGVTMGLRAVTNGHGWDDGYAEYWTGQNPSASPMQQETINFGCNVVELTGKVGRIGGKDVYEVYTLDGFGAPPDASVVNQFTAPWLVCFANISRREPVTNSSGDRTGWTENIVIPFPQLPSGVPIPFAGKGHTNYIAAERIRLLSDGAEVPDPYKA